MNDRDSFESQLTAETFAQLESAGQVSMKARAKTSLRLKYEAEIAVLKREIGGLEEIRIKLGFSRRKICHLLMVDPSAWTRWTGHEGDAPPHIYRSLTWYLDSKTHQLDRFQGQMGVLQSENRALKQDLETIRSQFKKMRVVFYALFGVLFVASSGALIWALVRGP